MKGIVLCMLSTLFILPLSAQEKDRDSLASEISTLEKQKSQISSRVDQLSEQLTNEFSLLQSVKAKIESIDATTAEYKTDVARIQAKKELTVREKKIIEDVKRIKVKRDKHVKEFSGLDSKFNKKLAVLDETLGQRNELDEKIQQLKAQYATL